MRGSIADQLEASGVSKKQVLQFDVFSINDELVVFPEERLNQTRTRHKNRLIIIFQNDRDNSNPIIKIVTIAPLSTGSQHHRLDYLLKKEENHFLPDDSYIRTRHIQPILKVDLSTKWGNVSNPSVRDDIKDRIFSLYDL